jgi:hypothetical protein
MDLYSIVLHDLTKTGILIFYFIFMHFIYICN